MSAFRRWAAVRFRPIADVGNGRYFDVMTPSEQQALLGEIHGEVRRLASLIAAPFEMLPQPARSINGTWLSLEWREANDGDDEDGWYLSLMRNEDGHDWELSEVGADNPDYLLYVIFDELTAKLARREVGDERIAWFGSQEALLGRLSLEWQKRTADRHAQMLQV